MSIIRTTTTGETFTDDHGLTFHHGVRVVVGRHENGAEYVISDSQRHPQGFGGVRRTFDRVAAALASMPAMVSVDLWTVGEATATERVVSPLHVEEELDDTCHCGHPECGAC
jgi:hypothetical protein